jgi:hypothetical protein
MVKEEKAFIERTDTIDMRVTTMTNGGIEAEAEAEYTDAKNNKDLIKMKTKTNSIFIISFAI